VTQIDIVWIKALINGLKDILFIHGFVTVPIINGGLTIQTKLLQMRIINVLMYMAPANRPVLMSVSVLVMVLQRKNGLIILINN